VLLVTDDGHVRDMACDDPPEPLLRHTRLRFHVHRNTDGLQKTLREADAIPNDVYVRDALGLCKRAAHAVGVGHAFARSEFFATKPLRGLDVLLREGNISRGAGRSLVICGAHLPKCIRLGCAADGSDRRRDGNRAYKTLHGIHGSFSSRRERVFRRRLREPRISIRR
jgi:hypothetical protein